MSEIIQDTKSRMKKSIENLSRELANISAGRANSNLLNGVNVDYYGAPTPVQQLASINVPEARLLVISPYNIRRDINDQLKKDEKNGDITEDDLRSQTEDVQKVTDNSIKEIDNLVDEKEKDIMSV